MSSQKKHIPIGGSERAPFEQAREVGPADPKEKIDVTLRLRSRIGTKKIVPDNVFRQPLEKRKILSRQTFEQKYGALSDDVAKVEAFALEHQLTVREKSAARRTIVLSGTVATIGAAFEIKLKEYEHVAGNYRGYTGQIQIPADLSNIIEGVFGLDNRPQAKPHFRRRREQTLVHAASTTLSYTPTQVASLYQFPTGLDGSGECIALIELGGGYTPADLDSYWRLLNLKAIPNVSAVSIGDANNSPTGDPNGPDGEVTLDIEVAGAIAPGAKIVVYFADNTDAGFLNAITTAIHDKDNNPTILSISWGGPESSWTQQAMTSMDEAFQAAALLGVTVIVASGDGGSSDGLNDGLTHVDFPASSPHVLSCGGTHLVASGNTIASETVWNDLVANEGATGGGISNVFPLPTWQNGIGVPTASSSSGGRGVPDVAGNADPSTGYETIVDGEQGVIGGTSAVAPLWAGLIALINQDLGKPVGFINPLLYQNFTATKDFNDITSGNNGAYSASRGWDACTGLGSPIGIRIEAALSNEAQAQENLKTGT